MSQKVGLDFMHADQRAGRIGHASGGPTSRGFGGVAHDITPTVMGPGAHLAHMRAPPIEGALRIAADTARGHLDTGGTYMPPRPGFGEMGDYRSILSPTAGGVIQSEIPGRTDHIPTSVAADSYVIPADVVSGLGEGNTQGGSRIIQEWMSTGPHGIPLQRSGGARDTIPRPPAAPQFGGTSRTTYSPGFARGGDVISRPREPLKTAEIGDKPGQVPVIVAGGEYIVDPRTIAYHPGLGHLDPNDKNPAHYRRAVNFGHKILDAWVLHERAKTIKTLKSLPGPQH